MTLHTPECCLFSHELQISLGDSIIDVPHTPTAFGATKVHMKKVLISLAVLCAFSAHASGFGIGNTTNDNRDYSTTNKGGAGGEGGTGFGIAGAVSGSASESTAIGGSAHSISGGNLFQGGDVSVTNAAQESNTPPVIAGNIPAVPTSCRLYLFGGGATRDGAASGSIPLGNDETCLSIAKLNLMERAGGFTQSEKQAVACKVEGMAELKTCQALAK